MKYPQFLLKIVSILGASAVILGAIGAHSAIKYELTSWTTAVQYHFIHTLALLGLALLAQNYLSTALKISFYLFLVGILLFSGSIYFMGIRKIYGFEFGAFANSVTPIGGLTLIAAWISLLFYKK
jgi:uncharacterized membrane protein YgdD (TMEM256/DUF423 family)